MKTVITNIAKNSNDECAGMRKKNWKAEGRRKKVEGKR
jgi:hypothetical protein